MMASHLESEFEAAVSSQHVPGIGAIALDKSGREIFSTALGTVNTNDPSAASFTLDTQMLIFSCTKLVTSIACLQLIEQGRVALDDPVDKYVPLINDITVIDGFEEDGTTPKERKQNGKATVLNLFTHTAGFSYDFFDKGCLAWRIKHGESPGEYVTVSALKNYKSAMRHDPGADYTYGCNTDYLGWVVEKASGMKLENYVKKHILEPLGMKHSGLKRTPGADFLAVHMKGPDGKLKAEPGLYYPEAPEVVAGGHYLTSTLRDYSQVLLALLNNGTHPKTGAKILEEKTVQDYAFKDFIPQICKNDNVGKIEDSSIPVFSNDGEFMPGINKGWSCGLLLNNEDLPNGRAKGSGAWAGLGNLYYWIDRTSGKLGLIGTAVFPFLDVEVLHLFDQLERFVYGKDFAKEKGEKGSNYVVTRVLGG